MQLVIDVGNSNTVVGVVAGQSERRLVETFRLSTKPEPTADEFLVKIDQMLRLRGLELRQVRSVVLGSVVPLMTETVRQAFARWPSKVELQNIDSNSPFSFKIMADPPWQVGADRLINAEAAVRKFGAPVIIVDSGTATTLCAVDSERRYLGGVIMPGLELAIESLARRTAKLYVVDLNTPRYVIGKNTQEAMQSGILFGYASMIDGMVDRFQAELGGAHVPVVATGGVSSRLREITKKIDHFDPDLTLSGLMALGHAMECQ